MKALNFIKLMLPVLLLSVFAGKASSQDDQYKDLLFMIIDGDLEKAAKKAEAYTDKEKTDDDPMPYLYASMAYFEMSKDEKYQEDYPRAFRDAIKFAYKFRRKDKELTYFPQHRDYINELKAEIMREARMNYESEDYRRSTTYTKYISRIDPADISALLLKGVAEAKGRNAYQSKLTFEEAAKLLAEFNPEDLTREEKENLKFALIEYSQYMQDEGNTAAALEFLDAASPVYAEDKEFNLVYDQLKS